MFSHLFAGRKRGVKNLPQLSNISLFSNCNWLQQPKNKTVGFPIPGWAHQWHAAWAVQTWAAKGDVLPPATAASGGSTSPRRSAPSYLPGWTWLLEVLIIALPCPLCSIKTDTWLRCGLLPVLPVAERKNHKWRGKKAANEAEGPLAHRGASGLHTTSAGSR